MARTNASDVKTIMDIDTADATVDVYINSANVFVTEHLDGKGLTAVTLEQIELWVTCHLLSISPRERQIHKAGAGTADVTYTGKYGMGLELTTYGQQAIVLDSSRTLASVSKKKASLFAVPFENK